MHGDKSCFLLLFTIFILKALQQLKKVLKELFVLKKQKFQKNSFTEYLNFVKKLYVPIAVFA